MLSQEEYTGALVYVSDLEGKITKVNLSSLSGTFNVNQNTGNATNTSNQFLHPITYWNSIISELDFF